MTDPGASIRVDLALPQEPRLPEAPAPPAPRPGERPRRPLLSGLGLVLLCGVLGFAQGARVALGAVRVEPHAAAEATAEPDAGTREPDALRGSFWAPARSTATRPGNALRPARYEPRQPAQPDATPPAAGAPGGGDAAIGA